MPRRYSFLEVSDGIQTIIMCARHQSMIAGDILSTSRLHKGLLIVMPVGIPLAKEVRSILSIFDIQAKNSSIRLEIQLAKDITSHLYVSIDPVRLNQIILNLISKSLRVLENWNGDRRCIVHVWAMPVAPLLERFNHISDRDELAHEGRQHLSVDSDEYAVG